MTSITSTSHPSDPQNVTDHLSPRSSKSLLASTWQVLDQPPPPSLREILGAYRTRGNGDREMLTAMLNAKSAEDQRIASVASLHRSMLEYYQISSSHPQEAPYPSVPNPTGPSCQSSAPQASSLPAASTPHHPCNFNSTQSQRSTHTHPHKRIRTLESPPTTYHSISGSYAPSPPPGPSSPYSSRSASADQSPCSRDAMAIGSLLSRNPRGDVDDSLQNDSHEDRSQLRRQ